MTSDKLSLSFEGNRPGTAEIEQLLKELRETRDVQALENLARKAAELRPDQPEFHFFLGIALHNQGKAKAAEQAYGACLRLNPKNVTALVNLGSLQISSGQPTAGLSALEGALYLDPGNVIARIHKGRGLSVIGKADEALEIFEELAGERPNDVAVMIAHALCHVELGQNTKAAELLSRAIELNPDDASLKTLMDQVTN